MHEETAENYANQTGIRWMTLTQFLEGPRKLAMYAGIVSEHYQ